MERIWLIAASLLMIAAAVSLWRNNLSAAFVSAALGAVAWFLSYRAQLRAKLAASELDSGEQETSEKSDEK
jgi:F0F1-type ATP synthase assembly protein I